MRRHSAARPKVSGKTAFFPRNARPYGLKFNAVQTENALKSAVRLAHSVMQQRTGIIVRKPRGGHQLTRSAGHVHNKKCSPYKIMLPGMGKVIVFPMPGARVPSPPLCWRGYTCNP